MKQRVLKSSYIVLMFAVLIMFASCSTKTKVPEGFAELTGGNGYFRAISPEGFRYEVYERANDPKQSLDFWNQAYDYRMKASGYTTLGDPSTIKTGIGEARLHEWVLSWGNQEYVFAHAIALKGGNIVIVQMGGRHSDYDSYRKALVAAIESLN